MALFLFFFFFSTLIPSHVWVCVWGMKRGVANGVPAESSPLGHKRSSIFLFLGRQGKSGGVFYQVGEEGKEGWKE